jgi:tripartite-type tricarboxylate transporter receptor subunit TctC
VGAQDAGRPGQEEVTKTLTLKILSYLDAFKYFVKIRIVFLVSMLLFAQPPAQAQDCAGPLGLFVGLSAGGGLDIMARLLAQRLTAKFGRSAIVENKAGAGGNIGAAYVAKAPPDGCTLLATGNNHTINPMIYPKSGYEIREFVPVIRTVEGTSVLVVNPLQSLKNLAALVDYAKANPGKLSYSSAGIGFPNHVAMELFLKAARIDLVHVPYKGSAPALTDTIAGFVPVSISSAAAALRYITSGKLRALAVSAPRRWPTLPAVPNMAEAGFRDATSVTWLGIVAPAATPLAVRTKLNREFRAILEEPEIRERLRVQGYETVGGSIQDFDRFLQEDERVTRKLMNELKLKVE